MPTLSRPLAGDLLHLRLEEELFRLTRSAALSRSGRSARTLVKDGPLRVTLIALAPNGRIAEHRSPGPITIQALYGRITLAACGESRPLAVGDLLSLEGGVEHAVESSSGGAFLLTVVAPDPHPGSPEEP